jgi:hypothetical protein
VLGFFMTHLLCLGLFSIPILVEMCLSFQAFLEF